MGLTAWFFWLSRRKAYEVERTGQIQEAAITVKGGYSPDLIVVKAGIPVRLNFNRQEDVSCSEMVLFPDFNISRALPAGKTVPIEFTPDKPGEYDFSCQMGMFRGKLIVEK